jgi:hypothetical protein
VHIPWHGVGDPRQQEENLLLERRVFDNQWSRSHADSHASHIILVCVDCPCLAVLAPNGSDESFST